MNSATVVAFLAVSMTMMSGVQCQLQKNFELNRYTGVWYEIYRTRNIFFQKGSHVTANYSLNSDGSVKVFNREWRERNWNSIEGRATVPKSSEPARLSVKFPSNPFAGDYSVLYTDYDNIAVVYSDVKVPIINLSLFKMGWVLARQKEISADLEAKAFEELRRVNLEKSQFLKTNQTGTPGQ